MQRAQYELALLNGSSCCILSFQWQSGLLTVDGIGAARLLSERASQPASVSRYLEIKFSDLKGVKQLTDLKF